MRLKLVVITLLAFLVGALIALLAVAPWDGSAFKGGKSQQTGKALIGGPFTLTDQTGKRVTEKDFLGKYMLVYFGYTYCPDVCPTELQVISGALDKLGAKADDLTPVFITVDPKRDTPEQMASYVSHFHKKLVGLTGSEDDIRKAAKTYRIYYKRSAETQSDAGKADEDYLMDHSNVIYLMDKDGSYLAHFTYSTDPDALAEKLEKLLK